MENDQENRTEKNKSEILVLSGKHCAWGHLIEEMSPNVGEALSKAYPGVQLKSSSPNKGLQPFAGRQIPQISKDVSVSLFFIKKLFFFLLIIVTGTFNLLF